MRLRGGCLLTMTLDDILTTVEGDCKCTVQYQFSFMRNLLNKLDRSWMTCAIIFVSYEAKFIVLSNRLMSKNSDIIRQDRYLFTYFSIFLLKLLHSFKGPSPHQ
jgi:hypothetical protein